MTRLRGGIPGREEGSTADPPGRSTVTSTLQKRIRRACRPRRGCDARVPARRTGGRLSRAALRELQQRPRRRPPLDHAARHVRQRQRRPAGARRACCASTSTRVISRPRPGPRRTPPRAARSSAPSPRDLTGTSPLRVLSHGKDAAGTYVRAGIDVPSSTASIIGDDNLVMVIRRTPVGRAPDVRARPPRRRRQARRPRRRLDAPVDHARPAQLDRLRRQEPRHHATTRPASRR